MIACGLMGAAWGCGGAPVIHRPTVGIAPFEAVAPGTDGSMLRGRAAVVTNTMRRTLESDSTIRVLDIDPRARPRSSVTYRPEGIGHVVYGSLTQDYEGKLVLSWRLVSAEDGAIVVAGNTFMVPGAEADSLAIVGRRLASLLRGSNNDST